MTGPTGATAPAITADLAGQRGPDLHFLVMVTPAFQQLAAASAGR
jgi:hypothetical protein